MSRNSLSRTLFRSAPVEKVEGRTVFGLAVPYGDVIDVNDFGGYRESFERGAFAKTIKARGDKVKLFTGHDRQRLPIGRATELRESAAGLHAAFEIAATRDGDDALELVKSGTVDSFSIGFRPIASRSDGDVTVMTEVALMEVSLVGIPAYEGAAIAGVRSHHQRISTAAASARLRLLNL
ncbi:HK97 family phage prohead protease [Gordonia tangerina]|uniref:HK97 family phage prohead protease n=1 Tax=Gordonia tangerina TaxID=2911060 RepID=A0ABS9DLJ3_9ACTN|nr:HK97 family phage prohead protease [Gordonia tangerina]MCF3939075.1 HK97 family phage prohead protease [Gordonia tangerina]